MGTREPQVLRGAEDSQRPRPRGGRVLRRPPSRRVSTARGGVNSREEECLTDQVQIRLCATQCAQEVSGPGVSGMVDTRVP